MSILALEIVSAKNISNSSMWHHAGSLVHSQYVDHYGKHVIDGLSSDTEYIFVIEPLSVGNPPFQNATPPAIRTLRGPLGSGYVAFIIIGAIVATIIVAAGVFTLFR